MTPTGVVRAGEDRGLTSARAGAFLEPVGLLYGVAAAAAVRDGVARWLAGGPVAFALVRATDGHISTAAALAQPEADRLSAPVPPWAGLPTDRPLVMGVVNVTPDSFSDGGVSLDPAQAIAAGRAMLDAGADIIDVGGESTRPGAAETDPAVEQARVLPVVRALAEAGAVVSIDTRHAATMAAAVAAGARIVNDVSGLDFDPDAPGLVRREGWPVVVMHMRGTPATMRGLAQYGDPAIEVAGELADRLARLGLAPGQAAVDPGIGFAKDPVHSEAVLARLPILANLGCRILVGASRKGFIGQRTGVARAADRLAGSLAAAVAAVARGASILRVHDVAETVQALRMSAALHEAT